jgi:hypothetical protein
LPQVVWLTASTHAAFQNVSQQDGSRAQTAATQASHSGLSGGPTVHASCVQGSQAQLSEQPRKAPSTLDGRQMIPGGSQSSPGSIRRFPQAGAATEDGTHSSRSLRPLST